MKRKALGRGLGALIPEAPPVASPIDSNEIDIDRIQPNPDQPRFKLDDASLDQLAASIREHGVLQPVVVRRFGDAYQLVAGERRLTAAQRAGLLRIPTIVKDVPDERMLELALTENIQREQLNPVEEAQAYQSLLDTLGTTQEDLAKRLGKERSTVANALRLLKLPPAVKLLVAEGKLSPGHARALLASNAPPAELARVAQTILQKSWSVRDAERWAQGQATAKKSRPPQDPDLAAAVDRLRLQLGTKVDLTIQDNKNGAGQLRIHFFSREDLERIYNVITRA